MVSKYSQLPEHIKEKMRQSHRNWAAKNDRKKYYKQYEKKRCKDRIEYKMFISARTRSRNGNLPFNIEETDIIIPDNCPICLEPLQVCFGIRGGSRNSPTLDRVYPGKGYVKGNVAVICKNCNSKKGHSLPEELRRIADWIETF